MLDHLGIRVADLARSRAFYRQALAPLDIDIVKEVTAEQTGDSAHVGFGDSGKPDFWISDGADASSGGVHVAFVARTRADVDAFHRAALVAGARDNGAPGLRPHYHANYYGAFVLDADGDNIEAVCHLARI